MSRIPDSRDSRIPPDSPLFGPPLRKATAIQTVRNQAGRSAYARSASWSIRSARTALDGLSEGQLSTFRFGSSPACDR